MTVKPKSAANATMPISRLAVFTVPENSASPLLKDIGTWVMEDARIK